MVIADLFKQPQEVLRFRLNLRSWLEDTTIFNVEMIDNTPPEVQSQSPQVALAWVINLGVVEMFFMEGEDGVSSSFTVRSTATDGRIREDELVVRVRELRFNG